MIRFGSGPVTMMLGLILATGSAVPIIARCGGTGVLAKGSGGTHSVGETKVSPAVAKARDLESELERLRTERILWDAERALALTEKAYDAGCQREFLETLLERRVALQRCDGLMDMVIFALSCVTVYNSAPESEWKSFAPIFRLQPVVGVNGRDPNANDGIVKVYMRLKAGIDHSGHTHTAITHPEDPSYRLFYRTDVDRDGKRISLPAETRVHLQSHWGSGVKLTGIEIRPLEHQ
jgi:hypothetical protein